MHAYNYTGIILQANEPFSKEEIQSAYSEFVDKFTLPYVMDVRGGKHAVRHAKSYITTNEKLGIQPGSWIIECTIDCLRDDECDEFYTMRGLKLTRPTTCPGCDLCRVQPPMARDE